MNRRSRRPAAAADDVLGRRLVVSLSADFVVSAEQLAKLVAILKGAREVRWTTGSCHELTGLCADERLHVHTTTVVAAQEYLAITDQSSGSRSARDPEQGARHG